MENHEIAETTGIFYCKYTVSSASLDALRPLKDVAGPVRCGLQLVLKYRHMHQRYRSSKLLRGSIITWH